MLHGGRLYIANVSGQVKAFDPATGSEHWSVSFAPIPFIAPAKLHALEVAGVGTRFAIADAAGRVQVVRDDGMTAAVLHSVQLPDGVTTPGFPAVRASGPMIVVDSGGALASSLDGEIYPIDLVAGTVGAPLTAVNATALPADMLLEPAGLFGTPASFVVSDDDSSKRHEIAPPPGTRPVDNGTRRRVFQRYSGPVDPEFTSRATPRRY